ncbi:MAG: AI-2E family transporter [Firmicutes bacterium]|nr:AI-2E family transporter [Bacillota bacterium]
MKNKITERMGKIGIGGLTISLTVSFCIAILFYLLLAHLGVVFTGIEKILDIMSPVILGVVLAYIVDPLAKFLEEKLFYKVSKLSRRRNYSVLVALLIIIILIILLLVALIPQLISSITGFFSNIDSYSNSLSRMFAHIADLAAAKNIDMSGLEDTFNDLLKKITAYLSSSAGKILQASLSFGSNAANFFIASILAIYFLLDKKRLLGGCDRLLRAVMNKPTHDLTAGFLKRCNDTMISFIVLDLADALVVGAVNFLFMIVASIPYAVLISIIVGLFNLAPTFGPIIGCLIGAFLLLLVNPWYALVFIIFTIVLQIFDGYIFKPKLFGNRFGVSAVAILIFIIIGGGLFGVTGILIAIPLASIADYIYQDIVLRRLEARREQLDTKNGLPDAAPADPAK